MDEHETTGSIVPLSPLVSLELLQRKLAEFYWKAQTKVQARIAEEFTKAFAEIDRAIDTALIVPLQPGTPREEVAAVVKQAAAVKEAVKEPLRQRLAGMLAEDRRAMHAEAEYARRRMPRPQILTEPAVVTPIVASGPPPNQPKERRMVLLNNKM